MNRFFCAIAVVVCFIMWPVAAIRSNEKTPQKIYSVENCDKSTEADCTPLVSSGLLIPNAGPYEKKCKAAPHSLRQLGIYSNKNNKNQIIASINIADTVFVGYKPAQAVIKSKHATLTATDSYVYVLLESCFKGERSKPNKIVTQIIRIPYAGGKPVPTIETRTNPESR